MPPLDLNEVKWIRSIQLIGACIGTLGLAFVGDILGRKHTLNFMTIPYIVCICLIKNVACVIPM